MKDSTRTRTKTGSALATVALGASLCTYAVVGDSQQAQIRDAAGVPGSVAAGCGYTGVLGWPLPCTIPLDPVAGDPVILGGSLWDVTATVDELEAGYHAADAAYRSAGKTVIWVEVPHVDPAPGTLAATLWSDAEVDALNLRLAAALGCELVDRSVREAEYGPDGIHYTEAGALDVAADYAQLTEADQCVRP